MEGRTAEAQGSKDKPFDIRFPKGNGGVDQDEEWCEVAVDGDRRRFRFHDYHELYAVPGLYEQLFYGELKCDSPRMICSLFQEQLDEGGFDAQDLRVLDVGAGNGMVGEELAELGAGTIVGVDIIEEAKEAAERDRPGVYDDYLVLDLTAISRSRQRDLQDFGFNCLTTVAALGFGDIPPQAFAAAFNFVSDDGWIAFNIKDEFLRGSDDTGFSRLIRRMLDEGTITMLTQRRYTHRLSAAGEPLHYVAVIASKHADVPMDWADEAG